MIKVQDGRGGWDGLAPQPFGDRDSRWQWQPDTDSHDPNPPITLLDPVAAGADISAAFTGTGSLVAAVAVHKVITSAVAGVGALASAMAVATPIVASIAGLGALSGAPAVSTPISAAMTGTGSFLADVAVVAGTADVDISAAFSGLGALSVALLTDVSVATALSGAGSLSGAVSVATPISAALTGMGSLSADVVSNVPIASALSGTGALLVDVGAPGVDISASLSGVGSLSADVTVYMPQVGPDGNVTVAIGPVALGWYAYQLIPVPVPPEPTPDVVVGGGSRFPFPFLKKRRPTVDMPRLVAVITVHAEASPGQVISAPAPAISPIRSRQIANCAEVVRPMRPVRAWDSVRLTARRGVLVGEGASVEHRMVAVCEVSEGDPSLTLLEVAVLV